LAFAAFRSDHEPLVRDPIRGFALDQVAPHSRNDARRRSWNKKFVASNRRRVANDPRRFHTKGVKVSDAQMAAVNLSCHLFHGDWNYTISPYEKIIAED
jgi:hypothetical protein